MSVMVLRSWRWTDARAAVDDATLSRDRLEHHESSSVRGRFDQGSGRHLPAVRQPQDETVLHALLLIQLVHYK